MCLAVPAQIVEKDGDTAWVQLGESRMKASLVVTPDAGVGDWVLVHAGFAIQQVSEEDARETFRIFAEMEAAARDAEDEDA
jgi:hydrogenase expression/formation protein HypC